MSRAGSCWLSATVAACVALTACSGDGNAEKNGALTLTLSDTGSTVSAARNERIDLMLQTIGPGEYSTPSISSESVRFVAVSLPAAQNPGGPTQDFRFETGSTGTATITIPHSVAAKDPFEVTIVVR